MNMAQRRWHTDGGGQSMLLIECPWCGQRDESEFSPGGEADIVRPLQPDELDDAAWADYLFMRKNTKGWHRELWNHSQGCRLWFGVERHTVTYAVRRSYQLQADAAQNQREDKA